MNLYDAHQHFHFDQLTPHRAQIDRDVRAVGLKRAVVNGTNEEEWPVVAALPATYDWVLPSFGVHPWDAGNRSAHYLENLRTHLLAHPAAHVGEVGLDRWIIDGIRADDPRIAGLRVASLDEQSDVFAAQLALATRLGRTVSIHCVQAWGALRDILKATPLPARGFLLHGYPGPAEMIKEFTALGAYYSFNIQLLEPRYVERLDNFRAIPADRLLVETDAPTKAPTGDQNRFPLPGIGDDGVVNHPANLAVTYEALATLRAQPLAELADTIEENFQRLFL